MVKPNTKYMCLIIVSLSIFSSCGPERKKMASTSMEGTIAKGETILVSPVDKIERNDILAFNFYNKEIDKTNIWIFRVIGLPGDTVQIVNAEVYINGQKANAPEKVKYRYLILSNKELNNTLLEKFENERLNAKSYRFYLTDQEFSELKSQRELTLIKREILSSNTREFGIFDASTNNNWNSDNYGPLIVQKKATRILSLETIEITPLILDTSALFQEQILLG